MQFAAAVPSLPPRVRRAFTVLAVAAPIALVLAGPAAAVPIGPAAVPVPATGPVSESATAAAAPPASATPHCALVAGSSALRCFATYRAAIAYGTGGRVTDAPLTGSAAAVDRTFAAEMAALPAATPKLDPKARVLLGTEYANANFLGASLNLFGAGNCDNSSDADFRFASMPAGWNDRITSFRSFSNCAQQLFRSVNFTGGSLTLIITSLANVGAAANDQASSITFN
jgi:hypothetical protein